jgi:hypothetical protein
MKRVFILGEDSFIREHLEDSWREKGDLSAVGVFPEPPSPWVLRSLLPEVGVIQALGLRGMDFAREARAFLPSLGFVFLAPGITPPSQAVARLSQARTLQPPAL